MNHLVDYYAQMVRIRHLEDKSLELSLEGFYSGSVHLCNGHEAVPVAFGRLRRPEDKILATYRGHGWAVSSGIPLEGILGEICQRAGGINGGRAGSLMISSAAHGFIGENSIIGAGLPIAAGVALAARLQNTGGVAICAFGDGAMSQGGTHEGLVFAAANNLPVVFVCENNGWAEMTPTSAVSRTENLSDRAVGYGISAKTVDGCDARAVDEAAEWALSEARAGNGPVFLEFKVARLKGHYNRDIQHYRSSDDIAAAEANDPVARLRATLLAEQPELAETLDRVDEEVAAEVAAAEFGVRSMPLPTPMPGDAYLFDAASPTSWGPVPSASDTAKNLSYWKAVNTALTRDMRERPEMLVYGEDVAHAGGIFGVTRGLQKEFGEDRVFDAPIAETAILGSAVGAAISGLRPVVEIMWMDFLLVAMDQLINQAANVRFASQGAQSAPMTVRIQQGVTPGSCAQHSQSLEALLTHIPGIRVGLPATPGDAYAMLRAAIADPDPVVVIESRELYQMEGAVDIDAPLERIGGGRVYGDNYDVLVVTWGAMVQRALAAQESLRAHGVDSGVLDLRWLAPLDRELLIASARAAGGRVVIAHEANMTGGFGAEVLAILHESLGREMPLNVTRVATPDIRVPTPPNLQDELIPGANDIVAACRRLIDSKA